MVKWALVGHLPPPSAASGVESVERNWAVVKWNVLVVDDQPDIYAVTEMALKRKSWWGRGFATEYCESGKAARELLAQRPRDHFSVALIDVVMESEHAGLELVDHIRDRCPRSLRLILRTGQPGTAPEESVLRDYDIDHYLAKSEATAERIYNVVRASLRASVDLATLQALQTQTQRLASVLREGGDLAQLMSAVAEGLKFLDMVYEMRSALIPDVEASEDGASGVAGAVDLDPSLVGSALRAALSKGLGMGELVTSADLGLAENQFVVLVPIFTKKESHGSTKAVGETERSPSLREKIRRMLMGPSIDETFARLYTGVFVAFAGKPSPRKVLNVAYDLSMFLESWKLSCSTLYLQERDAYERAEVEMNISGPSM